MVADVVDRETGEIEPAEFPEVRVDKRFVTQQQGRDFVLFAGLVDALHQLSGGYFSVDTRIEQLPTADNGHTAVCSARVQVFDPVRPDVVQRSASGIGDASPANVSRMMATATIRMAETRAKARALRDLCNVGMVSFEELGQEEPQAAPPAPPVASPPVEGIVIEGRRFSRPEVVLTKRSRVEACQEAGIPMPVPIPADEAPLREQVGFSQRLRELLLQQRRSLPQGVQGE